jgi:MFS family permease
MPQPSSPSTALSDTPLATVAAGPPGGRLASRTFVALLVAQFFAAFNDQAIHAAAMFYAINTQALTERDAISLMPILFYAPWAVFCTVAGWLADRYPKRTALVFWKVAEVGITAVALVGFYLGRNGYPELGPWLVLSTVFLMGTHSAFFVPAKYGVMPEILPPERLSKGNGVLESLSFFAVILGTVSGGVLSFLFLGEEVMIGAVLFALALVGAAASVFIRRTPAADPHRPFPAYVYGPVVANVRTFLTVPALRLVLGGLVFFTFMVAFMRAAVYMLGESQNPRWDELRTSAVVGTVGFGIFLGSPLAGWLSGRRIELRLIPVGAAGMALLLAAAAVFIDRLPWLVLSIVGIGFFTGFYLVPLFTLLQHKAPKGSKGDMIATSNFVNVTGAIIASVLFFAVVFAARATGLTPPVTGRTDVATGELTKLALAHGRPVYFEVTRADGTVARGGAEPGPAERRTVGEVLDHIFGTPHAGGEVLEVDRGVNVRVLAGGPYQRVDVSRFAVAGVTHFDLVPAGLPPAADYDNRQLPRYLFAGAAGLTGLLLIAVLGPVRRLRRSEM